MRRFARLYLELDESNRTNDKVAALRRYFEEAEPADAAWAIYFLMGRKLPRGVNSAQLRGWTAEVAGLPDWLVDESYSSVGDLAETIALLVSARVEDGDFDMPLHELVESHLVPLRENPEAERRREVTDMWGAMGRDLVFVYNKLITGSFRVGVSKTLVIRALAQHFDVGPAVMAHRLMGSWVPSAVAFEALAHEGSMLDTPARPYPFFLASPMPDDFMDGERVEDFLVEWKWDGIRCQLIKRLGQVVLWSRGEDLLTDRFPEVRDAAMGLLEDGTVLDGEILVWGDDRPAPFQDLQPRIGRKTVSKKMLEQAPAVFMAYDILESGGEDVRERGLEERRGWLESLAKAWEDGSTGDDGGKAGAGGWCALKVSPLVVGKTWEQLSDLRNEARGLCTEGFILKRRGSPYRAGRVRGDWWKWKVEPYTIDAVLTYAQPGHGRRAGLFTDYTFGVWNGGELITIAKAYSGLSNAEINEVDGWVRQNTLEKFGPVRQVKGEHVFELAFEGLQISNRNKSGIAVRFPRISRWRRDKKPEEADTLDRVKEMLSVHRGEA